MSFTANAPASGKLDEARASSIRAAGAPGTEIAIRLPHHAPTSITSQYDDARAAPSVLEQVLAAAREGADALVINCTADTAVEAAREAVAIPVVGVSEAALHLAAQLADAFSVLTFADRIAARFFAMARRLGMAHKLVSVRSVEMPLEEITDRGRLAADLAQVATLLVCARTGRILSSWGVPTSSWPRRKLPHIFVALALKCRYCGRSR